MMSVSMCASSPSTRTPMDFSLKMRSWLEIPIIFARSWTRSFPISSRYSSRCGLLRPTAQGGHAEPPLQKLRLGVVRADLLGRHLALFRLIAARLGGGRPLLLALGEGAAQGRHEVLVAHGRRRRLGGRLE